MNVVVCKNGHHFDADTYGVCPHCGEEKAVAEPVNAVDPEKTSRSLFGKRKKPEKKINNDYPVAGMPYPSETRPKDIHANAGHGAYTPTVAMGFEVPEPLSSDNIVVPATGEADRPNKAWTVTETEEDKEKGIQESDVPHAAQIESPQEETGTELQDAIKKASANPEGKTLGFFKSMTAQSSGEIKEIMPVEMAEPPAGWLICVQGAHLGECFAVVSGRNVIGRSESNDIVLAKDNGVSREKQAWVIYEPRKREFYIQPGDSSALTYLNGNMIVESHKLGKFDKVEFGDTALLLFPLCSEEFSWDDYIKKED